MFSRYIPQDSISRQAERNLRNAAMAEQVRRAQKPSITMAGGASGVAVVKTQPKRNRALLDMANGMQCLMRVPGVCTGDRATTVAAHSNLSIHGKSGARKADDHYSVWACAACHGWLDQGKASGAEKERAFMAGHVRQVEAWRGIAAFDPFLRDRNAAQWALDQLAATPIPEAI